MAVLTRTSRPETRSNLVLKSSTSVRSFFYDQLQNNDANLTCRVSTSFLDLFFPRTTCRTEGKGGITAMFGT